MERWYIFLKLMLITVPLALVLALVVTARIGNGPFLNFAFIGSLIIFLSARPPVAAIAATALVAITLGGISIAIGHATPILEYSCALFGAASLIVGESIGQRINRECYYAMLLLPAFVLLSFGSFLLLPSDKTPSMDQYLYFADRYLGDPSFLIGRMFASHPWISEASGLTYSALPLAAAIVFVILPRFLRARFGFTLVLAGIVGFLLFPICPAAGPRYAFRDAFPLFPPGFSWKEVHPITIPGVRLNAMPSLHVTWALLILKFGWKASALRRVMLLAFLILTILATLGSGEHYGVDLIAAVPFTIGITSLLKRRNYWWDSQPELSQAEIRR